MLSHSPAPLSWTLDKHWINTDDYSAVERKRLMSITWMVSMNHAEKPESEGYILTIPFMW